MKQAKVDDVTISASDLCDKLKEVFNNGFKYSNGVTGNGKDITWDKNGYVNKAAIKFVLKKANG